MDVRGKLLLFVVLLSVGVGLRLWGLDRDPPPYDVLPDAAPWTDEGTIGLPAYQVVRGEAPFDTLTAEGGRPLHRLMLYEAFQSPGPAQLDGRLVSVLMGLLGLVVLAALGEAVWPGAGPVLALILGGTGFFFVIYDRLLLTEGPTVALLALLALGGIRTRSPWGGLAVGVGLALLTLGFKPHALALAPALAVLYAMRRRALVAPFLLGLGLTYAAWRLAFIPAQAPTYLGYLQTRIDGEELGLAQPLQALLQIAQAGVPALYLSYQMPLLLLASFEGMAFFLGPWRWLKQAHDVTLLALVWLMAALVGASVFRYLPPRYFHMASPALLILAIAGARRFWQATPWPRPAAEVSGAVSAAAGLFYLYQVAAPVVSTGGAHGWVLVTGVPLLVSFALLAARPASWSQPVRARILACFVAVQVLSGGWLYMAGVVKSQPRLEQAAQTLAGLPADTVLTGRLAGTVALMAPVRGVPALNRISLPFLDQLATDHSVWVLILERDEFRVDADVWPFLTRAGSFPIDYSRDQPLLNVYRFSAVENASNPQSQITQNGGAAP